MLAETIKAFRFRAEVASSGLLHVRRGLGSSSECVATPSRGWFGPKQAARYPRDVSTAAREMIVRVRVPPQGGQGGHQAVLIGMGDGAQQQFRRLDVLAVDTATSSRVGLFAPCDCLTVETTFDEDFDGLARDKLRWSVVYSSAARPDTFNPRPPSYNLVLYPRSIFPAVVFEEKVRMGGA
jgi:hypothetical protein